MYSARNKDQKLVGRFLKIGHFVGYWLPSHWKCTVNLAGQNGFWSAKCWNWLENYQWPAAISSTVNGTYTHGVWTHVAWLCFVVGIWDQAACGTSTNIQKYQTVSLKDVLERWVCQF